MRAVVLVGGFGTRLRPLTYSTPKQMLPVAGVPMIERVVAHLGAHGVTEAVLSLGYKPDAFREAYPDGSCAGVALAYAVEPEPLDTAGAIRFAAAEAGIDDTFVVVNGDVLTDLDVGDLWRRHRDVGAEGTIALTQVTDPSRYGVVPVDADGRVIAFVEKPPPGEAPTDWINAGTYVLEPSVLGRIPAGRRVSIERETFPALVGQRTLFARHSPAYWIDAGTPVAYLDCQLDLLSGRRPGGLPASAASAVVHGDVQQPTLLCSRSTVDIGASVVRSVIGDGARVESGARVEESVLLAGATVGQGARVVRSIVGPHAVVGPGANVCGHTVVGDHAVVDAGSKLDGARVPEQDPDLEGQPA